ncbi:hypothetical protein [Brevibacillus borstelensis]|uniref:hypothetical protein n=1 Tax=Brevibacillus borstelensis TaxID=45462 RepID=UPI00116C4CA5|nr:hypothetical protein [Brevibacillus borstelensis]GED53527.1 hypothetical protein BBO01nite_27680 [Brevibacillus borstelensis]
MPVFPQRMDMMNHLRFCNPLLLQAMLAEIMITDENLLTYPLPLLAVIELIGPLITDESVVVTLVILFLVLMFVAISLPGQARTADRGTWL